MSNRNTVWIQSSYFFFFFLVNSHYDHLLIRPGEGRQTTGQTMDDVTRRTSTSTPSNSLGLCLMEFNFYIVREFFSPMWTKRTSWPNVPEKKCALLNAYADGQIQQKSLMTITRKAIFKMLNSHQKFITVSFKIKQQACHRCRTLQLWRSKPEVQLSVNTIDLKCTGNVQAGKQQAKIRTSEPIKKIIQNFLKQTYCIYYKNGRYQKLYLAYCSGSWQRCLRREAGRRPANCPRQCQPVSACRSERRLCSVTWLVRYMCASAI